ncbi:hypothetical protein OSTOST_19290 [Ostertagia ostertagi]
MKFIIVFSLFLAAECYRLSEDENRHLKKTCGVRRLGKSAPFKIFGGRKVAPGKYPWLVKIFTQKDLGDISFNDTCSGSLISSRHVITAAHCVTNYDPEKVTMECEGELNGYLPSHIHPELFQVYVGTLCSHPERCQRPHRVKKIFIHKKWNRCLQSNLYNSQTQIHDFVFSSSGRAVHEVEGLPICLPARKFRLAKLLRGAGAGRDSESDDPGLKVARLSLYGEEPKLFTIVTSSTDASACGVGGA